MATPSTSACARRLRYNRPPFQEWPSKHSYDLMTRTSAGELPDLFHLSYRQDITEFSPFSCPIFLGHPEASGCFMGGTHRVNGGTGKAEDAKLQDAGIGPKQCLGKCEAEKGSPTELGRSGRYRPGYHEAADFFRSALRFHNGARFEWHLRLERMLA